MFELCGTQNESDWSDMLSQLALYSPLPGFTLVAWWTVSNTEEKKKLSVGFIH